MELDPAKARPIFHRIDSLRILGAMTVAGYHLGGLAVHGVPLLPEQPWPGVAAWQQMLLRATEFCLAGHSALMVFFVVSGFVLRVALEYGPQTISQATAKFVLGRLFRVYPIVIFGVLVTALAMGGLVGHERRAFTLPLLFTNGLLLDVTVNVNYWALQVEMLLIPVILALYFVECRLGPTVVLALGVTTALLSFSSNWAIWPPLSHNLFAFVLGTVLPTFGRALVTKLSRRSATFWTLGAITVLLLTRPTFGLYSRFSAFCEAWAALVLVSMAAFRQDVSLLTILDVKLLRRAGQAAGSYYVLHTATFGLTLALAHVLIPPLWSLQVPSLVGVLVVSLWLAALIPLSVLTYHLIEVPGIELGRRFIHWIGINARRSTVLASPGTEPPQTSTIAVRVKTHPLVVREEGYVLQGRSINSAVSTSTIQG